MRRASSFLAVTLLACTLAGCGNTGEGRFSGDTKSEKAAEGAPTSSSPASPSSSAPPTTSSSASSSASPSVPAPCRTADVRVALGPGEGAAGSTYYPLRLTNTSGHPCRTGGFGGVSLVSSATGKPIGAPADRTKRGQAKPIVLDSGQRAEATLRVVNAENYPTGKCQPVQAKGFRVYPPNETHSAFVKHPTTGCRSGKVHLLSLTPYKVH
jgi:predicted small lipoprotein YifL